MIRKALSKIAIAPLPGTPKATVGMSSPPSFELFAAPGPKTMLVIPDADHNDHELLAGEKMIRAMSHFLQPLR